MNYFDKNKINYALVDMYECKDTDHITVRLQDGRKISIENDDTDPARVDDFMCTIQAYRKAVVSMTQGHDVNNTTFDQHMDVLRKYDYRNNS